MNETVILAKKQRFIQTYFINLVRYCSKQSKLDAV